MLLTSPLLNLSTTFARITLLSIAICFCLTPLLSPVFDLELNTTPSRSYSPGNYHLLSVEPTASFLVNDDLLSLLFATLPVLVGTIEKDNPACCFYQPLQYQRRLEHHACA